MGFAMAAEKTISLATDVLDLIGIGLWSVEIDEGRTPRMYADETMLELLGLPAGTPCEDVFHAWFDNIDPEHFAEVKAYVDKMSAGGKAEIQYPWHSPDGRVRFVRCGGTRDYEYKNGVRLKGWHRDITELVLIQKTAEEELRKEIKTIGLDAKRESLQSALNEKLYGKAILDKAYSYFKVNLSEGKVYRPFIQIIEGKSIDISDSFGPAFPSYDAVLESIAENALDPEYRDSFVQHLSAKSLIERFQKGDSIPEYTCRSHSTHIGWHYSRFVCYISKNEILDEYQAMMVVYNISEQQKQAAAIKDCIDVLYTEKRSKDAIEELLSKLASFYNADRAYILESDKDREYLRSTYEWCRKGVKSEKAELQHLPFEVINPWLESVGERDAVYLDSQNDESGVWARLYSLMPVSDVTCISVSTIVSNKHRYGFVVLDNPKESQKSFAVLKLVAGFVENEINRRKRMDEDAAITALLASDYSCIFYCDLEADQVTVHKLHSRFKKSLCQDLDCLTYAEAVQFFTEKIISPKSVEEMRPRFDVKNIKSLFQKSGVASFEFINSVDHFCECKIVAVDKSKKAFVVGFADKDEQIRMARMHQTMLQDALSMAQSSNRAKTTFLSNMSHDIRTPMNAIVGFTELAMAHIDNKELVLDYLKKLAQSSNHLLSLINDVLDMSRIESGKMFLSESAEDLSEIVKTLTNIAQADIDAKNLYFEVDMSSVRNTGIMCDKLRLNQVLLNVLSNAIKYTQNGGSIHMQVTEKESLQPDSVLFEFRIRDNGMGMNAEFLKTIYEPFTRANSSTVSGIQGTGLGMSITKSIVEMMGGRIETFSEENKGTEVVLDISFKLHDKESSVVSAPVDKFDFKGRKILIVEDNKMNRDIAQDILVDNGLEVFLAENGQEAVEMLKNSKAGQYDLVLMDVQMPVMDGYTATRQIRALGEKFQSAIPIVAMTANAFEEDRRAAFDAGMDEHISKPIDFEKMKYILAKFLKQ